MGCCHSTQDENCEQLLADCGKSEAYSRQASFSDLSMSSHSSEQLPSPRLPSQFLEAAFLCRDSPTPSPVSVSTRQLKWTFAYSEEETN